MIVLGLDSTQPVYIGVKLYISPPHRGSLLGLGGLQGLNPSLLPCIFVHSPAQATPKANGPGRCAGPSGRHDGGDEGGATVLGEAGTCLASLGTPEPVRTPSWQRLDGSLLLD